jgi:5-methylcytosine-specific restriction endonuclease McrA
LDSSSFYILHEKMPFTNEYAKILYYRMLAGEGAEDIAEKEDVSVDEILELANMGLSQKNDIAPSLKQIIDESVDLSISPTPVNVKKVSRNQENLINYRKLGRELPKCVNSGCTRFVAIRHWNDGLIPSLKTECTSCSTARKSGKVIEGIKFEKKHYCENKDGRLGFMCPCDQSRYGEFPTDCYHMDHINGNHSDNRPENIMTLCMMCHTIKGKRDGDFNGTKTTSLRFDQQVSS